jgi:hypothetical protein
LKFGTYGNSSFWDIGDCTFASAANWEIVVQGKRPKIWLWNIQIPAEFRLRTGQFKNGLTMNQFISIWKKDGIAGTKIKSAQSLPTSRGSLLAALSGAKALIASLDFSNAQWFGPYKIQSGGGHAILVDGVTPMGPLVVSWGETIQMTWAQWNAEADSLYRVSA